MIYQPMTLTKDFELFNNLEVFINCRDNYGNMSQQNVFNFTFEKVLFNSTILIIRDNELYITDQEKRVMTFNRVKIYSMASSNETYRISFYLKRKRYPLINFYTYYDIFQEIEIRQRDIKIDRLLS